jgi:hypothetical protein
MVKFLAHLSQVLAPCILVRKFKEFHLQPAQSMVFEIGQFLFDVLDILDPSSSANHRLDEDAHELDELVQVLFLGSGRLPQAEEGL